MTSDEYLGHPAMIAPDAERDDDPPEPDEDAWPDAWEAPWGDLAPACPWCGFPEAVYLGTLGRLVHVRCRACGADHHHPLPYDGSTDTEEALEW